MFLFFFGIMTHGNNNFCLSLKYLTDLTYIFGKKSAIGTEITYLISEDLKIYDPISTIFGRVIAYLKYTLNAEFYSDNAIRSRFIYYHFIFIYYHLYMIIWNLILWCSRSKRGYNPISPISQCDIKIQT